MKKFLLLISVFASVVLASYASSQGRICGTMDVLATQLAQDPSFAQRMQEIENQTLSYISQQSSKNSNRTNMVVTIPVVFHVVYNTSTQNVSDAQLLAQLNQLNLDFAKLNSDASSIPSVFSTVAANTQIQFCLAQRTPTGAVTNGIERRQTTVTSFSTNDNMKFFSSGGLDAWNASQYLNIWTCNMSGGILGYAQFPGGSASTDGVVLQFNTVGSMLSPYSGGAPYNLGRTATHEVGHWLNLRHIWGDANCGSDLVNDTPTHNTSNYGCPAYPHYSTCTGTPIEMTMNYMDYTDDACMYMFTAGQSTRMNALFASGGARAGLVSSLGCVVPNTCGAPTGVTASNLSSSGVTISWTPSTSATSYTVQYCISGTTNCTTTTTTGSSVTLSGLTPGTAYTYSITSSCTNGTSAAVNGTFTTFSANCGDPTNLIATPSTTAAAATLTWIGVSGATNYTVQYKTTTSTTWTSTTTSATSFNATGLASSATYNWQVRANCIGITGNFVAGSDFTTVAISCGNPSGLAAGSITSTGATLSWTAVSGASSYNVQYKTSSATSWTTVTTTTTSRTLTGLTAGTTYNWQVSAVCSNGASSSYVAGPNFTTLAQACTDNYESNNTRSAAKTIPQNTSITGLIPTSSDRDWFKFTTTSPNTNIRISLSNLPFDYDISLYNSSGSTLATSQNSGTTSEQIIRNTTSAASYFIQVYPYGTSNFSSTGCYTLLVSTGSTAYRLNENNNLVEVKNEIDLNDFILYPNPAQNVININYHALENGTANIRFFDLLGKVMIDQQMLVNGGYNKLSFDLTDFNKGVYFVEIVRNNERTVKKLIIER
ncbi:MAG: fibronectin type III domain-containing protein [Bacteroidota bacterium]